MSENQTSESAEKPAQNNEDVQFPPFAEPTDDDFEDDIIEEERAYYKTLFPDINTIKTFKLHCTACDRHIGCCPRNEQKMRCHPMLRTLICNTCYTFYNSGEFEKGDDGSELYCRWCGQGGQVYCCSSCPHVFCAKCVKRNFGPSMIKEIESNDDWKCFKCNHINPRLWELRATCWALLRFCTIRNKTIYLTKDPELKEKYLKECSYDVSECCKRKREKKTDKKKEEKKENDNVAKKGVTVAGVLPKTLPTIQVKKFASIKHEDTPNKERKSQKRSLSPKTKTLAVTNPIAISPAPAKNKMYSNTYCNPPKKVRVFNPTMFNSTTPRYTSPNSVFPRAQRLPKLPTGVSIIRPVQFNGFNNFNAFPSSNFVNDNINLSLDNLTQGLDMANVIMDNNSQDDDVVCTPDFPIEPLCEVTEESMDDDVQCITPSPATPSRADLPSVMNRNNAPLLIPSLATTSSGSKTSAILPHPSLPDLSPDNIVQMTENDVSVNSVTGGLKFRVDPQTLSSNKMYRLPDGRIFAINPNPNMPGGYSASIVSTTTSGPGKNTPKGAIYAAKLTAMNSSHATPPPLRNTNKPRPKRTEQKNSTRPTPVATNSFRKCDLNVPVEWFRYNLIDAVDALEYSMSRMNKLKREATTMYLRTRSIDEMSDLSKTVENVLNTSISRFKEINENLDKGLKDYIRKKNNGYSEDDDDDDDVEIVQEEDDGPIFIDENSLDSQTNETESRSDLTDFNRSDLNDSSDKVNPKSSQTPVNKSKTRDKLTNNSDKSNKTKDNNEAIDNYEDEDDLLADPESSNVATVDREDNNEKTIDTEDNNKTTVDNVDEDYLLADPESSNVATADNEFNHEKTVETEDNNKTTVDNEDQVESTVDNDVKKETSVDSEINDETTVDSDVNKEKSVDNEDDETTVDNDVNDKMSVDNEDNDQTAVDNDTAVDIKDDPLACSEDINELDQGDEKTNDKETEEKENEEKDLKNDVTLDMSEEDDRMDDVANGDIKSYKEKDDGMDISGEI